MPVYPRTGWENLTVIYHNSNVNCASSTNVVDFAIFKPALVAVDPSPLQSAISSRHMYCSLRLYRRSSKKAG